MLLNFILNHPEKIAVFPHPGMYPIGSGDLVPMIYKERIQ